MSSKIQAITACAFIYKDGKLLIAKRADTKKFLPGKYELLGGHVEFGETLEEALRREVQEELHVDITIGDPFYAFTYVANNGMKHAVEIVFFAELSDPTSEIRLNPEDHSEYRWITEEESATYLPADDPETAAAKKGCSLLKKK